MNGNDLHQNRAALINTASDIDRAALHYIVGTGVYITARSERRGVLETRVVAEVD